MKTSTLHFRLATSQPLCRAIAKGDSKASERTIKVTCEGAERSTIPTCSVFHLRFAPKLAYFKLLIEAGRSCLFVVAPIWFRPLLTMTTCVALLCPVTIANDGKYPNENN